MKRNMIKRIISGVMLAAIQKMNDVIMLWTKDDKTL